MDIAFVAAGFSASLTSDISEHPSEALHPI
jgi:hypothetical protein